MILRQDLRTAWYSLCQAPSYACTVVLTLALSLAMLLLVSLLNYQVLLAPLPYPAAGQLMVLSGQIQRQGQLEVDETFVMPALTELYQAVLPQAGIRLRAIQGYGTVLLQQHAEKHLVTTSYVTADYDELLAVPMHLGRFFQAKEELQQHQPVAVLSYQSWQQQYQGRADILSKSLLIQGQMFQIIGVTAKGFIEPKLMSVDQSATVLWLPFDFNPASTAQRQSWSASRTGYYLLASLPSSMQETALQTQWSDWLATQFRQENAGIAQLQPYSPRLKMLSLQSKVNADSPALLRRHELGIRLTIGAAPSQLWQQLSRAQLTCVTAGAAIGLSLLLLQQWLLPIRQLIPELTVNAVIMPIGMLGLLTLLSCSSVLWPILRQPPAVALRGT